MTGDGITARTVDGFFPSSVAHGFFTRRGGVSRGVFESLNCKTGSGDSVQAIAENRARVARHIGAARLVTLDQVHGNICVTVGAAFDDGSEQQGDALVTDRAGCAIGILTADCAPVLFAGQKPDGSPVIGAAHAGWGGALKGVCESAIHAMEILGAARATIRAAIGPCIAAASYEVGPAFPAPFLEQDQSAEVFFKTQDGRLTFDLGGYVAARLRRAGIGDIVALNEDTYAHAEDYFSFRRSTHHGEKEYGRQISVMAITG